jgi:hypothetical protein
MRMFVDMHVRKVGAQRRSEIANEVKDGAVAYRLEQSVPVLTRRETRAKPIAMPPNNSSEDTPNEPSDSTFP